VLKKLGCKFSLDDFGSGLSSFTYLKNLPVDYLKIDGQFIHNVAEDSVDESMVMAINQVGKAMGIETIAERVESKKVLDKLSELGVEFAQGYYIARPTSVQTFEPWADDSHSQPGVAIYLAQEGSPVRQVNAPATPALPPSMAVGRLQQGQQDQQRIVGARPDGRQ
jgi:sensor c-di-GMP phosphodiesterase-like protein